MRTLACFHVVKPCLWNSDHEWKISICRQFPNSISSHVCTRLRCYIVAYKHCDLFCWETSYFPWRNQQETLKNYLKILVFIVRRKKIKFKKCARAILDSDDKMPSCSIVLCQIKLVPEGGQQNWTKTGLGIQPTLPIRKLQFRYAANQNHSVEAIYFSNV